MAYNIGLNVVEVDGAGAPPLAGAAVSVGAFNILTQRGVPNTPARITSFQQFSDQFGSFFAGGLGAYLVKGFFDNGGQTAYINRVAAANAAPASVTLQDGAGKDTLKLSAGFRGNADPGSWGSDLFLQVAASSPATSRFRETAPATVTAGTALAAATNMSGAGFPLLSVTIDGQSSPTVIAFQASDFASPAAATPAEIRDAINRRTNLLSASLTNDNKLVLTSAGQVAALRKDWSALQVTADNATLGFTAMAAPVRGTPADRTTTGTRISTPDRFQPGDAVQLADGAHTATTKLLRVVSDGTVEWAPAVANIADFDVVATRITKKEFDLTIARGGTAAANVVETKTGLSMEPDVAGYVVKVLNDAVTGSKYVVASDLHSGSGPGVTVPKAQPLTRVSPGADGTATALDFIGAQGTTKTGFYAFDPADVQLVCTERTDAAIVNAALGYCANRGDCMFVGAVPQGFVAAGQADAYGQSFQGKKVYGALYGPWIQVADPVGVAANGSLPVKWIPPTGHVMGVYARIESTRGIWKAPAGDEANIVGALDVEYQLSDADHTDLVENGSVNGIRVAPGAGIVVDASRTLSTDTRWLYVNVRLLFNYVKSSLKRGLRWVRQEPNRDTLWDAVKFGSVRPYLMGLWRQGAFGTGKADQVFTIICDASNNPPDQVDLGYLKIEVYFYPSRPAETIIIIVGQQPSGATASEA